MPRDGAAPRYRAVVIGCGRVGSRWSAEAAVPGVHSHAQAYRDQPRTELVGVCDPDAARLADARRTWQVDGDADGVALCGRVAPDIVSICTPDATHAPLAERLLEETPPRLLFIEKPLALAVRDAERVLELAARRGTAVAVNHSRRFSPAFEAVRTELDTGRHGRALLVRMLYGKGLFHNGVHAIDLLRFWLGEPTKAVGQAAAWGPDGDETWSADVWFSSGCRARLDAFDERVATVFELDLLAERSRIRFWAGGDRWEFSEVAADARSPGYRAWRPTGREQTDPRFTHPLARCLGGAVENLVDHLDGAAPLRSTGEDGLAAIGWAERIRRSA